MDAVDDHDHPGIHVSAPSCAEHCPPPTRPDDPAFFEPPTFHNEEYEPGKVRPVLNKHFWMDPETGAVSW